MSAAPKCLNPDCFLTDICRFLADTKVSTGFILGARVFRNYFYCEELCLTGEQNFSKFLNPGMTKSAPLFQKQQEKIMQLPDCWTWGNKVIRGYLEISFKNI